MSTRKRIALADEIGALVMRWQDSVQRYDEAIGSAYGLAANEMRCLALLFSAPQGASAIAKAVGLTPASVTALIDRLEYRGYVRRQHDPNDRRRIAVVATSKADAIARKHYLPLAEEGRRMLSQFSERELLAVKEYLKSALDIQERFAASALK